MHFRLCDYVMFVDNAILVFINYSLFFFPFSFCAWVYFLLTSEKCVLANMTFILKLKLRGMGMFASNFLSNISSYCIQLITISIPYHNFVVDKI